MGEGIQRVLKFDKQLIKRGLIHNPQLYFSWTYKQLERDAHLELPVGESVLHQQGDFLNRKIISPE